jgi:superfamily II DNA/RNA helicase
MDKVEVLARVLQARGRGLTMIFSRTKRTAQKVADELLDRGFAAAAVHGDLGQGAREQALRAFRAGKVDVLVATDVAARGLDVEGVTHVINYQCPEDAMTYVHRIGRTARAGASGTAVTLVDWDDLPKWKLICDQLNLPLHEPAETYSTSPHLFLEMDIPEGVGGSLPRGERTRAGLDAETVEDLGGRDKSARSGSARKPAGGTGGRSGESRSNEGRSGDNRRSGRSSRGDSGRSRSGESTGSSRESTGRASAESSARAASTPDASRPKRARNRRRTRGGPNDSAEQATAGE